MELRAASSSEFEAITRVWEASVRATHHFLPPSVIDELRPQILEVFLPAVVVTVAVVGDAILGFSGTADGMLEMLFVEPAAIGRGIGKALLADAISRIAIERVDVNEANDHAVEFYRRAGFEVVGRSPLDGQGRPFPLLHLRLTRG